MALIKKECVSVTSKAEKVIQDIPQGSVLRSLLFLFYLNDLVQISTHFSLVHFAVDTHVLVSESSFHSNQLVLNANRTKAILFFTKQSYLPIMDELHC